MSDISDIIDIIDDDDIDFEVLLEDNEEHNIRLDDISEFNEDDFSTIDEQIKNNNFRLDSVEIDNHLFALKIISEYTKVHPENNILWLIEKENPFLNYFFTYINGKIDNNFENYEKWATNNVIDMSNYRIISYLDGTDSRWVQEINDEEKPLFIIVNKILIKKITYKDYQDCDIMKILPKLIIYHKEHHFEDIIINNVVQEDISDEQLNIEKFMYMYNHDVNLGKIGVFNFHDEIESGEIAKPILEWFSEDNKLLSTLPAFLYQFLVSVPYQKITDTISGTYNYFYESLFGYTTEE